MKSSILLILFILISCAKSGPGKIERKVASIAEENLCQQEFTPSGDINPLGFRKIFHEMLPDKDKKNLDYYVYLPKCVLLKEPGAKTPQDLLNTIGPTFRSLNTGDIFQEGKNAEGQTYLNKGKNANISLKIIKESLKKNKITLVIIPGLGSEFLEVQMFPKLLTRGNLENSTNHTKWLKALKKAVKINPNLFDKQLNLEATVMDKIGIGTKKVPIETLLDVTGVASKTGDLIEVIILRQPLLSTESITDITEISKIYLRRLNKVFSLMGKVPENIAIMGYSRGAPVVLEMVNQANKGEVNWPSNIKAAISFGGVLYGTEVSDETFCHKSMDPIIGDLSGSKTCKEFALLKRLLSNLEYSGLTISTPFFERFNAEFKMAKNRKAFFDFLSAYIALNPEFDPEMLGVPMGKVKKLKPNKGIKIAIKFAMDSFDMSILPIYHDINLKKLKILASKLILSVDQLTTKSRLNWWKNNNLPNNGIRYYSISGLVPNPENGELEAKLRVNPFAYNKEQLDFDLINQSFEGLLKISKCNLNDSQVTYQKSKFWNGLNASLNPYYKTSPLKTTDLGVIGVDHWGMALDYFYPNVKEEKNPFPRVSLLLSLAAAVSLDLD